MRPLNWAMEVYAMNHANVLNVLPEHKAGDIAFAAGLIPSGSFVPVDLQSYASTVDPDIHVIGDSHFSGQPKAGHVANSEAKVCADAIVREFGILPPRFPEEVPVTNSACYSPITNKTASWLTAGYRYNPVLVLWIEWLNRLMKPRCLQAITTK